MSLDIVILAAGQGTRMRSSLPKVLHPVAGNSMLGHVIHSARQLKPTGIHVVIGHGAELVRERLAADDLNFVLQDKQLICDGRMDDVCSQQNDLKPDND